MSHRRRPPPLRAIQDLLQRLAGGLHCSLCGRSLVYLFGQHLSTEHADRLARIQQPLRSRRRQILHRYQALIHADEGDVLVFHQHVEDGAAHRNHRGGRVHFVVIRLVDQLLDVNFDVADDHIQYVGPVLRTAAEDCLRVLENLEGAAVRNAELRVAVGSGKDDFARRDGVVDIEYPRARYR